MLANRTEQKGRSMVEMLGVLAIIGVLSVGGIAGYSRAMMYFKVNKTMSQVSHIAAAARSMFGKYDSYSSLGQYTNVNLLRKTNIIPEEMIKLVTVNDEQKEQLYNPFGGQATMVRTDLKTQGDEAAFLYTVYGLPRDACITIAARDWGSADSSGFVAIGVNMTAAAMDALYLGCTGSAGNVSAFACGSSAGSTQQSPLTLAQASAACIHDTANAISWKFY